MRVAPYAPPAAKIGESNTLTNWIISHVVMLPGPRNARHGSAVTGRDRLSWQDSSHILIRRSGALRICALRIEIISERSQCDDPNDIGIFHTLPPTARWQVARECGANDAERDPGLGRKIDVMGCMKPTHEYERKASAQGTRSRTRARREAFFTFTVIVVIFVHCLNLIDPPLPVTAFSNHTNKNTATRT